MVDKTKCPHGQVQWIQDKEGDWHQSIAYAIHSLPCMSGRRFGIGSEHIPRYRSSWKRKESSFFKKDNESTGTE